MDLVNSVTQNSNNRNVTMENQGEGEGGDGNNDGGNSFSPAASQRQECSGDVSADQSSRTAANDTFFSQSKANSATTNQASNITPSSGGQATGAKTQVPDYLRAIGMDPRKFWPRKYRFTREKPPGQYNPLTIAQRNFYESNGYLIIDDCTSQRLLNAIRTQHQESSLVNEFLVDKLVARNAKLLQFVKCFCDERIMLMTHRLIESFHNSESGKDLLDNKQAQRQQLFRDWIYLPFRPIDKVVCAVTAIEPIEHTLMVVPGTHRVGQCSISSTLENISAAYETSQEKAQNLIAREIFECAPEALNSLVEKSKKGFKYVSLKPGQTLFYHPGLVHGFTDDLVNLRKKQLASIAYYAAADCEYVDLRESLGEMSASPLPVGLWHFKDKHPSDYSSWIGKPRLLKDTRASL